MLKLLIISVVKIGTAEKPAGEQQTADETRQQVPCNHAADEKHADWEPLYNRTAQTDG
jgi:hypothetical protein